MIIKISSGFGLLDTQNKLKGPYEQTHEAWLLLAEGDKRVNAVDDIRETGRRKQKVELAQAGDLL